jgi:hypothetical protein
VAGSSPSGVRDALLSFSVPLGAALDPPTNQSLEEDFNMRHWTKHLMPNVGTLLVVGLLLLVQSVAARPALKQELQAPAGAESILSPSATLFSYQGQLLDAGGDPVDGTVDMTFRLYHQETDGTAFWTEAHCPRPPSR